MMLSSAADFLKFSNAITGLLNASTAYPLFSRIAFKVTSGSSSINKILLPLLFTFFLYIILYTSRDILGFCSTMENSILSL
jgi:hypothetical protein